MGEHRARAAPIVSTAANAHPADLNETALILGFAGLLPQIAAAGITAMGRGSDLGPMFAFGYASLILSFIGGIWWGFAMGCHTRQARTALLAVVPSLLAAALILLSIAAILPIGWALVSMGSAVLLTLLVDRDLAGRSAVPAGWMSLRIPLSIGLGGLTILTGILA